jgi:GTPase SAR1 family protein
LNYRRRASRFRKQEAMTNYSENLERHLTQENPVLLGAARSFEELDNIARELGLIDPEYASAGQISWWPVISVLGTFSAGKSTFINHLLQTKIQRTGNQAVDDKFTVLSYSDDTESRTLPGIALDADPRFPFFQISKEIDQVLQGEGDRINAYLQLKTCGSPFLKGKIIIDSPGFDADPQRDTILAITKHIIDISDLVLVFFDARHPEPGAMKDTLRYLVTETIKRHDSNKFLFILNQMDTTAREDNPEEVVAAWHRALAESGLVTGRFYTIFSPDVSVPIADETLRQRYLQRRDRDWAEINARIQQLEIERSYRILGTLERLVEEFQDVALPEIETVFKIYRKRLIRTDCATFLPVLGAAGYAMVEFVPLEPNLLVMAGSGVLAGLLLVWSRVHIVLSKIFSAFGVRALKKRQKTLNIRWDMVRGFRANASPWPFFRKPGLMGWSRRCEIQLSAIRQRCKESIQSLNDLYTNPSGRSETVRPVETVSPPEIESAAEPVRAVPDEVEPSPEPSQELPARPEQESP